MHRIDGAGHVDHLFVAEDPATLRPPTEITPEIMNAFQEELATFIEWAGIVLAKGDNTQLKQALLAKFAGLDVAATKAGVQGQTYTAFTTAGVTGAFTLAPAPAIAAYAAGQRFRVKFHAVGNGVDTINVSGLGAKNLKQYDSTGAKVAPVIVAGQLVDVEFDGVDFVLLDALPPAVGTSPSSIQGQTYTAFTTGGGAPVFTLTPVPAVAAYSAGQRFRVKFHAVGTTGSNTLNVSGCGAKNVKQYDGAGNKVPAVIAANQLADVEYDGIDMVILDPLNGAPLYESAEQTITSFTSTTVSHGLGRQPYLAQIILRCKTAEGGFAVGDEIHFRSGSNSVSNAFSFWSNSTALGFMSDANITVARRDAPLGNLWNITFANWRVVMRAW